MCIPPSSAPQPRLSKAAKPQSSGSLKNVAPRSSARASQQPMSNGARSARTRRRFGNLGGANEMPGNMSKEDAPSRSASLTFTIDNILNLKQRDRGHLDRAKPQRDGGRTEDFQAWDVRRKHGSGSHETAQTKPRVRLADCGANSPPLSAGSYSSPLGGCLLPMPFPLVYPTATAAPYIYFSNTGKYLGLFDAD
ncbi:hypothetical protein FQN60_007257 [Etheostoma spectabile]|uniref:Uncharacterized protein n=1 Tax=Etheostoma spectabile TaxID=54343 RepID=A0A5J5CBR4_9PERO|nr:hypothetical protein FQN60_007257 [Etheostoma spectabile]